MANSLGSLVVSLGLNATEFVDGLTRAEYQAKKQFESIASSAKTLQNTIHGVASALGVGIGVGAFVNLIKGTIEAADHLENLSKSTGVSVEKLGGLGFAAKQTGGDLDSMADAFKRFSVNAAAAAQGNEKQQEVFQALGISLKDLRTLSPDQLFIKAADAFSSFNEGINKSALGAAAFGKSYQGIIPTLDQGGARLQENIAYFERFGGVTTEVARQSSEFNTELVKLGLLGGAFGRELTANLLPVLKVLAELLLGAKENSDLFARAAKFLADELTEDAVTILRVAQGYEHLERAIKSASERVEAWKHLDFEGARVIAEGEPAQIDAINKKYDELINKVRTAKNTQQGPAAPAGAKRDAPGLSLSGNAGDAARQILAKELGDLDNFIKSEQDTLKQREAFLQDYYQHDEIGIADYFKARQDVIDEALRKQQDAFTKEESLLKARIAVAKPTERAEDEKKLADVVARRSKAEQDAATASVKAFIDESRAAKQFQSNIEQIALQVVALRGDTVGAAAFGFDLQNAQLIDKIKLEKQSSDINIRNVAEIGDKYINELRQRTIEQAKLNKAQLEYSNVVDAVSIKLSRVDLEQQTGALTEIDAINKRALVAAQSIGVLTQKLAEYEKIALEAPDGPIKDAAILNVEKMRLQIDQLAAASDVLAKKFDDIFSSAIADGIVEIVNGTKSLKDAIKDVEKQIVSSISKIAAQQLAESIFSKGGAGGGIGDFFAGIFGGKGGFSSLFGGGGASLGSGMFGGGGLSDLFGGLFAAGGDPPMGKASVVGENGPEWFVPKERGTIVPASVMAQKRQERSIILNFHAPEGMNRQTAHQAAVEMSRTLAIAQRNNR
jgi:hypothetical protein